MKILIANKVTSTFFQRPFKMSDMTNSKLGFWVTDIGNKSVYRILVFNEGGKKFCLSYELIIKPSGVACVSSQNYISHRTIFDFPPLSTSETRELLLMSKGLWCVLCSMIYFI